MSDYEKAREIILKRVKAVANGHITKEAIGEIDDENVKILNWVTDDLIISLRSTVWCQDVDEVRYKHPSGWWQAFKEQYFPAWLKKLSPVKYKKVVFDIDAIYPNFNYACPKDQRAIRITVMTDYEDDDD